MKRNWGRFSKNHRRIASVILGLTMLVGCASPEANLCVREIDVTENGTGLAERYASYFESTETAYDDENDCVTTIVTKRKNSKIENLSLDEAEDMEDVNTVMVCSFDMNKLLYIFDEYSSDDVEMENSLRHIETDAIITEYGGLDAIIEIDGESYRMSDYVTTDSNTNDCSFLAVVAGAIGVYIIVSEAAIQYRMDKNLKYNQKLESDGKGVNKGNYITDQSETSRTGYNSAGYHFGFTTFGDVGCEVAAAYNLNIGLDNPQMLSSVIFSFECLYIEYSIAWGKFGSDPCSMYRYFNCHGYKYQGFTGSADYPHDYRAFVQTVNKKSQCHIIMSRWNSNFDGGLHTFYIEKNSNNSYSSYNWSYQDCEIVRSDIEKFNDGAGFIVGYIIWK